ncbi:hypothetical protein J4423_00145 [Candidatus Pacearchaeota archaeon]|nr:hypothetical protein [Candidatus Pacearchaeota archaeon]
MDDTIHKLIAVISPDTYATEEARELIKKTVKEEGKEEDSKGSKKAIVLPEVGDSAYKKAIDAVKKAEKSLSPKPSDFPIYDYDEAKKDALNLWGLKSPIEQHNLIYDSPAEGLEPVYFWLLDFLKGPYDEVEKLVDNFVASPGSGHFSEMQGRATQMQQEVSRTMGNVNTVLKSVLNLVYDLKEFRIRLKPYKIFYDKETSSEEKYKQLLSLKQVWLDNVDIRKGRGSINALSSGELDFVTLRDAFMTLRDESLKDKDGNLIDLNDRVKRILQQRAQEFFTWIKESYNSLSQRFEIERNYLKSQVSMLNLYVKWVKPYLKAASKLGQNIDSKNPALVTAFNTMILELTILATSKYKIEDDVNAGNLPELFKKVNMRKYYKVLVIELEFRSIPQRVSQRGDWAFGGRVEVKFTSYGLNEDELKILREEIQKDDFNSVMKLISDATDESLGQIKKDIRALLEGKEEEDIEKEIDAEKKANEEKKSKKGDDFGLKELFSMFKIGKKKDGKKVNLNKGIPPDKEYEKVARSQAILGANDLCFTVFDTYKKGHNMPSHQNPYNSL